MHQEDTEQGNLNIILSGTEPLDSLREYVSLSADAGEKDSAVTDVGKVYASSEDGVVQIEKGASQQMGTVKQG